ncbi:hypothetical protein KFE94_16275 [bacterium SCSIO 12643]|nr:hypothetical protein KFE94_16275 [bacterium SCSIO 12643]
MDECVIVKKTDLNVLKYILLFVLVLSVNTAKSEVQATKMHRLFFGSSLIVKSKIVSHTDHSYKIQILDVFHDRGIGIRVGDFINIKKEMNVITSSETVHRSQIEARLTGVAFLVKSETGWHVMEFPFFRNDIVTLRFDYEYCQVEGTADEIKAQIQEYFREFHMEDRKLVGKKTEKEVLKSDLGVLALTQYYQFYRFTGGSKIWDRIDCGKEVMERIQKY